MTRAPLLVALLLAVSPALAGCLGGEDETPPPVVPTEDGNATAPPDGRGPLVAFEETNATEEGVGGEEHNHDLWNGAERLVLFDGLRVSTSPTTNEQGEAFAVIRTPPPALVLEGTSEVILTISTPQRRVCEPTGSTLDGQEICSDYRVGGQGLPDAPDPGAAAGTAMKLRYQHAATTEWIEVGDILWDTPLTIKVENAIHTDMPHSTSSLWKFMVASQNAYDNTLTFVAKAEIVRAPEGEIPEWPGHPLFYSDELGHTREVLRTTAKACAGSGCVAGGEDQVLVPEKLVSYGTRSLYVWLNVTSFSAPNPAVAPTHWFLYHRNATGEDNTTNPFEESAAVAAGSYHWILPVRDNDMDSPYADGSRWSFNLGGALTSPVLTCYYGCAEYAADYELVVHASDMDEADAYHIYCGDGTC